MIWTRLTTSNLEASPDAKLATTKRAPLLASVSILVCVASVDVSLESERCQLVFTAGTGTHTVASDGASASCTVVVTSKLRQLPGWGLKVRVGVGAGASSASARISWGENGESDSALQHCAAGDGVGHLGCL
jgi:hypothetical protein